MSEVKFACPVCGQHITAGAEAVGTQLECPTCFRKIIVPQTSAGSSNLILSASQVTNARPSLTQDHRNRRSLGSRPRTGFYALVLALLFLCAGSTAFLRWRGEILINALSKEPPVAKEPGPVYPIPASTYWTMELVKAVTPEQTASGSVHGSGFLCEKAVLQGGTLSLRQGKVWPPDLGISIHLFAQQAEDLSGKTLVVRPDRPPPVPQVVLRWKDEQQQPVTLQIDRGYALKVVFGQAEEGRMPGRIYISLPDESHSFAAGTFDALIRKPHPPKVEANSARP
jgi:hypothetical protein